MQKIVRSIKLVGLGALAAIIVAVVATLRHIIETPQPLESALSGESHIYRWKRGHIFYKVLGAVDASPLVLLHTPGVGASAYEWRQIMQQLAQHYRVYAPDLLGFGLSDRPQMDYSAETYITLCRDFLVDVVAQPATLLASRLSCNYAVAVATHSPEVCERLVLISPVELSGGQQLSLPKGLVLKRPAELPLNVLYSIMSTRIALRYAIGRQGTSRRHAKAQVSASDVDYLYATTHQFGAQHAPIALMAGKLAVDISRQLEALQQPTLIIWGAEALNNARYLTRQRQISPHTQIVLIDDAGIRVHEERPAIVVADIQEWTEEDKTVEMQEVKSEPSVEAYCVKCKNKRMLEGAHEVTMKNGRPAISGTCPVCGTTLYRIGRLS